MATSLDMSLDDIIKSKKRKPRETSFRGRAPRNFGPSRRILNRFPNRAAPYAKPAFDKFAEDGAAYPAQRARAASTENGVKVLISNLDYGVSNLDIKELFADVGDLKRYTVHYDRSGRSEGTAEVVFSRHIDAVQAIKKYNHVQLDGKPMKIEIVTPNNTLNRTPANRLLTNAMDESQIGTPRSTGQGESGGTGLTRGHGRGRRGRGWNRNHSEKVSAEDLDADLEKYHADNMDTS